MNLEMEVLSPSSYLPKASWLSRSTKWTHEENKRFENALAIYDQDTPDRWHKVASLIPGKTVGDVVRQYNELVDDVSNIEAGLVPIPGYNTNDDINTSRFTLAWGNSHGNGFDGFNYKQNYGKRGLGGTRPSEQERKKGVPWTEDEHKLFLIGLKKYGKGDWRNISRNFVVTRTPTQVASHAQKYFIRQLSGGKDKRRASIHDITTVNLDNLETPSPDNNNNRSSSSPPDQPALQHVNNPTMTKSASFQWQQQNNGSNDGIGFNPNQSGNFFVPSPYGFNNAYAVKLQGQNLQQYINGSQSMGFQMQHYQHG